MHKQIYGIIYKATSRTSNKIYIGQTINSLKKRINHHKHCSKKTKHNHFHSAIQLYGMDDFLWEILQECHSKSELDDAECFWINFYNSKDASLGYNLKDGGSNGEHSSLTKEKISQGKMGIKNPMFGKPSWNKNKKLSKEHADKIKTKFKKGQEPWNKGKKNEYKMPPKTDEVKRKIAIKNSGETNGMSKLTWEKVREIRKLYLEKKPLMKEIALLYNISAGHVSELINNKKWRENETDASS